MTETPRRAFMKRTGIASLTAAALGSGVATADRDRPPGHDRRRTRGRLTPLGQELPPDADPNHVTYTFGHVSEDGQWGAASSFPGASPVLSSLYDLSDLENPELVHELEAPNEETRSNDVKFDPLREGIYIRSLEADDEGSFFDPEPDPDGLEGIEVVDFDWEEGTPAEPKVLAYLETPNMGVHKFTEHPEEPVLYLIDKVTDEPGLIAVDFSDPHNPDIEKMFGPPGYCHDCEVEVGREALHAAYIIGETVGYVTFDISDPLDPEQLGFFDYEEQPDYTEIGEPGFELAHQIHPEPERELSIMGDEKFGGIPGGKHVFDTGWDEGSLEDPIPIGFTHSPDARDQDEEPGAWTTHFHDVVYDRGEVLLVDGGYTQGAWVANITDPTDPTPTERYATDDGIDDVAPFAWGAHYNEARDFAFATDANTGVYTFEVSGKAARGEDGGGPDHYYDLEGILGGE
ncbi:regulatory P domain-containing protein [Natronococcus pandeyae]|uniref:Regulatory P domain-containing protein n=1 Tax=Natronococcus pandeyae TaxID=2055836 RepID=A0A8J8TQD0_9EURY|nr:regulatory P domain-containing protein [Natronococcus pandeyae]TYL36760.1 regulatory P domain-containing protein [Natronococcus pandeyae]